MGAAGGPRVGAPEPRQVIVASRWLLRAAALPAAGARREHAAQVENALALIDPDGVRGGAARGRYLSRMAFRATPAALFAGVAVGTLAEHTAMDVEGAAPLAHLHVRWARLAAIARALLDQPAVRTRARLRVAPSLLRDGRAAMFLARGRHGEARARTVRLTLDPLADPALEAVLAATQTWTAWPRVRAALGGDPDSADDLLLLLLDDGLLHDDLTPPLVGPPPLDYLTERLARIPAARATHAALRALQRDLAAPIEAAAPALPAALAAARDRLRALPGAPAHDGRDGLDATLLLRPAEASLARAAVERAAALAPLLIRLLCALGPLREHATPALTAALRTLVEDHGPGRFDLARVALGAFGVTLGEAPPATLAADLPGEEAASSPPPAPHPPLLRLLVERLLAAGAGNPIALDPEELDRALPAADLPPSVELTIAPAREPPGAAPGTGWLLGLHGPAGATWGRFSHAIGAPLQAGFAELAAAERAAWGEGTVALDLSFAPSAEVADVACHPPLRRHVLALTEWPAASARALRPAELLLDAAGPLLTLGLEAAPAALALATAGGAPALPLPLARVRSTTIDEEGPFRLLAGATLLRAVAPWALHLGALATLPRLPRITLDGFVIQPASWALPPGLAAAERSGQGRATLARWRRDHGLPRRVQVGSEDRLLPVDLDDPDAAATLLHLAPSGGRAWEIWPPEDALADAAGHRTEAVVAVVLRPEPAPPSSESPPPRRRAAPPAIDPVPDPCWRTFRLFGAPDRADTVLLEAVAPTLQHALAHRVIDGWFFLRYLDEGGRHHLRLRVSARAARHRPERLATFAARLDAALAPHRADGDLAAVESADYRPERARWGGERATRLAESLFESDSRLCLELLALAPELRPAGALLLARSFDALGAAFGLDLAARLALASAHRAALSPEPPGAPDPLAPLYRAHQRELQSALESDRAARASRRRATGDAATPLFAAHQARLRRLLARAARGDSPSPRDLARAALPDLLHLAAVRLLGPGEGREATGAYLWQRALASLAARARRDPPPRRR